MMKQELKKFDATFVYRALDADQGDFAFDQNFVGDALDLLGDGDLPSSAKLEVVLKDDVLPREVLRSFSCAVARELMQYLTYDPLLLTLDVAEAVCSGIKTELALEAAKRKLPSAQLRHKAEASMYLALWDDVASGAKQSSKNHATIEPNLSHAAESKRYDWQVNELKKIIWEWLKDNTEVVEQ